MSLLETSVQQLAASLDTLEKRLTDRMAQAGLDSDSASTARLHAAAARNHLNDAADRLSGTIIGLRELLALDHQARIEASQPTTVDAEDTKPAPKSN